MTTHLFASPRSAFTVFSVVLAEATGVAMIGGSLSCRDTYLYPVQALDGAVGQLPTDGPTDGSKDIPSPVDGAVDVPVSVTCPPDLVGFGATAPGATGGGNIQPVVVTTAAELAIQAGTNDEPRVIEIGTVIDISGQIVVKSNKTIRGTARGAGLRGGGLMLDRSRNVIVQRMTISRALMPGDAIGVEYAQNIWIDHCDLSSELISPKGTYDGLIDITHGSVNVTVSWNVFHDHYNPTLVGHSVNNAAEDTGALTVTYHHNWFVRTRNNTPRVRFGTVHVYNNWFQDIEGAVTSQMGAQVYVQGNVFQRVIRPIATVYEDPVEGLAAEIDNVFDDNHPPDIRMMGPWRPTYTYAPDPSAMVPAIVEACAGPGF